MHISFKWFCFNWNRISVVRMFSSRCPNMILLITMDSILRSDSYYYILNQLLFSNVSCEFFYEINTENTYLELTELADIGWLENTKLHFNNRPHFSVIKSTDPIKVWRFDTASSRCTENRLKRWIPNFSLPLSLFALISLVTHERGVPFSEAFHPFIHPFRSSKFCRQAHSARTNVKLTQKLSNIENRKWNHPVSENSISTSLVGTRLLPGKSRDWTSS